MSDPVLARYDFVSYVRRGAAAELTNPDPLAGALPDRGPVTAKLTVHSEAPGDARDDETDTRVLLHGPGDVVGIDPRHVIRTEPRDATFNYEPNYLAGIEFDHPDYPWLFTPAAPNGDRLRPWLCLLTLAEGEYLLPDTAPHPLPTVQVLDAKTLPDLAESWAFAHGQATGGLGGANIGALAVQQPERVFSRLVSARRLRPLTAYRAFLVPAFDLGVRAGLGQDVPSAPGTQAQPAWTPATPGGLVLPFYHSFSFQTADDGDFESLVRKLVPRVIPKEVGMRDMDVDRPGWGVSSAGTELGLGGALRSVLTTDTVWDDPDRSAFQADVSTLISEASLPLDDPLADPVVVPPLYGRWHAAQATITPDEGGWLGELNLDPRNRTMAGFGTRVVLDQRAPLMASAWRQVQGIEAANQAIRHAQLAAQASSHVFTKHLMGASDGALLQLSAPLHAKLLASPRTVAATLAESRLPSRALSPAFRRMTSARGPVRRRQRGVVHRAGTLVARLASGAISPLPPLRNPDGLVSLEDLAQRLTQGAPGTGPAGLWAAIAKHLWWIVAALVVVLLALGLIAGALVVALVLAVLVVAAALVLSAWLGQPQQQPPGPAGPGDDLPDALTVAGLTSAALAAVPPRPAFAVIADGTTIGPGTAAAPNRDSPVAAAFRTAAEAVAAGLPRPQDLPPRPVAEIDRLAANVRTRVDPWRTIPARIGAIVDASGAAASVGVLRWDHQKIDEIMAAPEFPQPMYEPLRDLSQDFLLPGVELVPHDTLGLLLENHAFVESYMVGLNHEMGRELLWNTYPTDQRGSYFRQFWDVRGYVREPGDPADDAALREQLKDIPPVHAWPRPAPLGQHRNRPGTDKLVLLVRGELLKRYPNAVIYACLAKWDPVHHRHDLADTEKHPVYRGTLSPDLTFFGFDLTKEEALGNTTNHNAPNQGWFFVFQQQPGEPRFGLEPAPPTPEVVKEWNDLSWANLAANAAGLEALEHVPLAGLHGSLAINGANDHPGDPANAWGSDAAQMAYILLRRPARVAVHAETMLPH